MSMHFYKLQNKGFTLVELLVAIAIFTVMTALLVFKYAGFSEGMTLTNLAYDVALTLREAQSYGINVQDSGNLTTGDKGQFNTMYGVNFNRGNDTQFILYADLDGAGRYNGKYIRINKIKQGNRFEYLCAGSGSSSCNAVTILDVQYRRPDPTPKIYAGTVANALSAYPYAEIRMKSPNGSYRRVVVRSSGQISVEDTAGATQSR
jgi:prepilin-type N-terminal cleavage/methylation domain-containing protein